MTKLDIWNQALALLPHDRRVEAEDEDTTEALRCRDLWDGARRKVLGARDWNALAVTDPVSGPTPRPAGALRVCGLVDGRGRRVRSRFVNGLMVSDYGAVAVRYVPDVPDPEEWPQGIAEAVAAEMAARLCPLLTDNAMREAALRQQAEQRLMDAGELDANEGGFSGSDGMKYVMARR